MPRRVRVMVVLPENHTTIEPEISALCRALAPLAVAPVKRRPRTPLQEDLPAMRRPRWKRLRYRR